MNRLFAAFRVLFARRILVVQVKYVKRRRQDRITMYGTVTDPLDQVKILRSLADSIAADHTQQLIEAIKTKHHQKN